jgi:predicted nucleotidyltransferase
MDRTAVIEALKSHEAELRKLGSTARDGAFRRPDVDIAVEMKPGPRDLHAWSAWMPSKTG